MSARKTVGTDTPATSLEVRGRLVEALQLDLVGPRAGHAFAAELLPGWQGQAERAAPLGFILSGSILQGDQVVPAFKSPFDIIL